MLGQPLYMLIREVVGFKLVGRCREGATATDLVLTVRRCCGRRAWWGSSSSTSARACRAWPGGPRHHREHGARVRRHLRLLPRGRRDPRLPATHRAREADVDLVERYCKEQGLFRTAETPDPEFTDTLELDLATVEPSLAGPEAAPGPGGPVADEAVVPKDLSAPERDRGFGLDRRRGLAHGARGGASTEGRESPTARWSSPRSPAARTPRTPRSCSERGCWRARPGAGPHGAALGEDQPGPRVEGGHRLPEAVRAPARPRELSASTWWDTAAPPASATRARCRGGGGGPCDEGQLVASAVLSGNRNFEGG